MFMFGFLKFFQPFRGWFDIQIQQSHLPHEAILAGKLGEMVTGVLFLLPWFRRSLTAKSREQLLFIACLLLFLRWPWRSMSSCSLRCLLASFLSVSKHL